MRQTLHGYNAAPGMALGRVRMVEPRRLHLDSRPLEANATTTEIERLDGAIAKARDELQALRSQLRGVLAREADPFLDTHALLLEDPELLSGLYDMIRKGHYRAENALLAQRDRLAAVFEAMDDPYLRSRREDLDHVIDRVLAALEPGEASAEERRLAARVGELLVVENPSPADIAALARKGLQGVIAGLGSRYSHAAILARSLHLPMLIGVHDALDCMRDGDLVLLDAESREAVLHPAAQDLARYRNWQRQRAQSARQPAITHGPCFSHDGVELFLYANAELPHEIEEAHQYGAAGIGLYRTELLYLSRPNLPNEDEQYATLRELVLGLCGKPATIRTLDLGADKTAGTGLAGRSEPNPALGVRGVRMSLRRPEIFRTQLRAILRVAALGPLRILIPMVSLAGEMCEVRTLAQACLEELRKEGIAVAEQLPPIGAMIEVPAAAFGIRGLLKEVDFLAVGTNDLAQYVLAADRNNGELADLYDPRHPALLRLVALVISVANRAGKPVSVCGEIAGDPTCAALLLALGVTEFSMSPSRLPAMREQLARLNVHTLRSLAPRLKRATDLQEVESLLHPIVTATD